MNIRVSKKIQALAPSTTLAVAAKAKALREQGVDVVDFGAGEPDFDTPRHIKDAAVAALAAGDTKYPTPVAGKNPLREALRTYFREYSGLEYALPQIHVSAGAKDALIQAFMAILDPGDEAIIPVPYWVSYPEQVKLAGGTPVLLRGEGSLGKISAAQLRAAISPRTRLLVLNSPSNPTGAVYSRDELAALAEVLRPTEIIVVSDELYHRLMLHDEPYLSFAAFDGMYARTVTVGGFSKTYAMTGWRLGFAGGPEPIIAAMGKIQGQTTSGAVSFVQTAAVAALKGEQGCVDEMRAAYRQRAERMVGGLNRIRGIRCEPPHGGFVCFPDVSGAFAHLGVRNSDEFTAAVLEKAHVAFVSGTAFGLDGHVRISFATSMKQIELGIERLTRLCA